jgi:hypothetical protein
MVAAPHLQDGKDESEPLVHCGSHDSPVPCSYSTGPSLPKSIISAVKNQTIGTTIFEVPRYLSLLLVKGRPTANRR